jgi:nicotinamidase-related amidase
MQLSDLTARQFYEEIKARPARAKFGFGAKAAIVNIDLQLAYTAVGEFATAYETDPRQIDYVNEISDLARGHGMPVIWTYVAFMETAADAGVWGTRTDTPDSLQNIKAGSRRAELDPRLHIDRTTDAIFNKRMASAFHETPLQSLLVWHKVDTVIITGGSTSGCVRATAVDSLMRGYRTVVPEECVADKHEIPHFANLADLLLKYADIEPVSVVRDYLTDWKPA